MRLLFVTPYVPSRLRPRPFELIRQLAAQGVQITLACLIQPPSEGRYLEEVRPYVSSVHTVNVQGFRPVLRTLAAVPGRTPLSVAYCREPEFTRLVHQLVQSRSFDLLHAELVRSTPHTARISGLPKVYDAVDSLALAYRRSFALDHLSLRQRITSWLEWQKLRRYEGAVINAYDYALVSSPMDQQELSARHQTPMEVIPNGVDLEYFGFQGEEGRERELILFHGRMGYYVNVNAVLWFYHRVFPLIKERCPKVKFLVAGSGPAPAIQALDQDPAVIVTGAVDDIRAYLGKAGISICPVFGGSGIQNKILEALAMGTPCVATSLTTQAIQVRGGQEILVGDTAADFAEAVVALIEDDKLRKELAWRGRAYVEQHHRWETIGEKLVRIYQRLGEGKYQPRQFKMQIN